MATAKAVTKFIRVQPRKARLAAGLMRGLTVEKAEMQLNYCAMKGGHYLKKTLKSAVANAELQLDARRDSLYVIEVRVDEGPRMRRTKSKSRGGRTAVVKRTSHFTVVVGEKGAREE